MPINPSTNSSDRLRSPARTGVNVTCLSRAAWVLGGGIGAFFFGKSELTPLESEDMDEDTEEGRLIGGLFFCIIPHLTSDKIFF